MAGVADEERVMAARVVDLAQVLHAPARGPGLVLDGGLGEIDLAVGDPPHPLAQGLHLPLLQARVQDQVSLVVKAFGLFR